MNRASTSSALAALALLALLAGCSPTTPSGSDDGDGAPDSSEQSESIIDSGYYPVAEGNTWVYTMAYPDPIGIVTETETMSSVKTDDEGSATVVITRDFHYENGSTPDFSDEVTYLFHADGSIEVPYQSVPTSDASAVVTVTGGTMVWPNDDEFADGTVKSGDITATVVSGGLTFDQSIHFEISGAGDEEVTVPFGTVTARKLVQSLVVSIPQYGVDLPITATSWLQADVGLVRTEIPDLTGGAPITVELVSFTPAP